MTQPLTDADRPHDRPPCQGCRTTEACDAIPFELANVPGADAPVRLTLLLCWHCRCVRAVVARVVREQLAALGLGRRVAVI